MEKFNFGVPADVFVGSGSRSRPGAASYLRFSTGAEAIRHVIEVLAPDRQQRAVIETDDVRLDAAEIRAMYEKAEFPLPRSGKGVAAR